MTFSCRWDVEARSRPAQASLGQRCASHGTIGYNIMLYPSNSGHARTHGVRWRNVCFFVVCIYWLLQPFFLLPALLCGCRFLLFVGGCCNRWLLQPAAVPACDSTTARSDAGWLTNMDMLCGSVRSPNKAHGFHCRWTSTGHSCCTEVQNGMYGHVQ